MFRDEKNLKDSNKNSVKDTSSSVPVPYQTAIFMVGSYTKTDKLITALYMVTDIIDKDEPLRNKLRTLGAEIITDIHLLQRNNTGHTLSFMSNKIAEIMSFLEIASAVNIISEMNCNILKKEFSELNQSILDSTNKADISNKEINLAEFFANSTLDEERRRTPALADVRRQVIGHHNSTNLGVQKGSTLLKALRHISVSDKNISAREGFDAGFNILKRQRRESIIAIIKTITGGATIKDIKDKAQAHTEKFNVLIVCSEKTLQRELVSMVKDNVLDKTGEKRWSRYFLK